MKAGPVRARTWDAQKIQMKIFIVTAERVQSDAMDILRSLRGSKGVWWAPASAVLDSEPDSLSSSLETYNTGLREHDARHDTQCCLSQATARSIAISSSQPHQCTEWS